jgi:hypothetical protein
MEEVKRDKPPTTEPQRLDVPSLVRQTVEEFTRAQQAKTEPAYKTELQEERKRREQLERRVNDLIEENKQSRRMAEEAERSAAIRAELQRLGVGKVDLAFKAVKDDIARSEDGRLVAKTDAGDIGMKDYLAGFVNSNPEFLPAPHCGRLRSGFHSEDTLRRVGRRSGQNSAGHECRGSGAGTRRDCADRLTDSAWVIAAHTE